MKKNNLKYVSKYLFLNFFIYMNYHFLKERKMNFTTKNNLKKQNPWEIKFIKKILMFTKKENFIDKKQNILKDFNLASFSIDTGAKLYAQKIDMLHNFVSGFLKGLKKPKKKSVWIKKTNFRLKKEVIVSLTTKIQIFNAQFFFLNLIKKTTSFFINSFLKKKIVR
jgi:hypothetical protein